MMKLVQDEDKRYLVADDVMIEMQAAVYDINAAVKKLSQEQHVMIIRDTGLFVPPGIKDTVLLYMAMSFVQNAWYEATATDGVIPQGILDGHEARLATFAKAAAEALKNPPAEAKAPKEPKVKVPKAPKAPKAPKLTPSISTTGDRTRVATRRYAINPAGNATVAAALSSVGFVKPIYETLATAGPDARLTVAEVITLTTPRKAFSGNDGGKGQAQYQLKYLAGLGLALYFDEQGNTPMPNPKPSELPQLPLDEGKAEADERDAKSEGA